MQKKIVVIILIVGVVILAGAVIFTKFYPMSTSANYSPAGAGQTAATIDNFNAVDLNGNKVTNDIFSDYKLTMINVWTTSCSPCLKEMPDLAVLDKELEEKGFNVIGIVDDLIDADTGDVSESATELAFRICDQTGVKYTNLIPDATLKQGILNGLGGYPSTFFVDKDGKLVGKKYFGSHTKDEWKEIIEELLTKVEASSK
ncbi:TlpA family protein disulfide reductase [Anaerocolumna sp. MB42-C2]|uniref:TlpA family protein disulfide reductase n=1 Tax=Anaerocolumna sp. MB42-C2 TaxID=3070997 RepID=UPI0027E168E3|nr:TlpA disulfide reductase family protein [Anaerocolumna sp. MB42-C2]WMJ90522.1 TlpA disulfide reductase family protein [Anaerocolumna sp. MB42-C2]